MSYQGQTGVVLPVPAADALLASVAARFPGVVREGVPAHLSVQYPFLDADRLDDGVHEVLAELFAGQPPLPVRFAECRRRGGFVYLPAHPAGGPAGLTAALRRHWPALAVPGGADAEVGPHVTVAMGATEPDAEVIEREAAGVLPIRVELTEAWLVAFDGQWVLRERFEFAG